MYEKSPRADPRVLPGLCLICHKDIEHQIDGTAILFARPTRIIKKVRHHKYRPPPSMRGLAIGGHINRGIAKGKPRKLFFGHPHRKLRAIINEKYRRRLNKMKYN